MKVAPKNESTKDFVAEVISSLIENKRYFGALAILESADPTEYLAAAKLFNQSSICSNYFSQKNSAVHTRALSRCIAVCSANKQRLENVAHVSDDDKVSILLKSQYVETSELSQEFIEYLEGLVVRHPSDQQSALDKLTMAALLTHSSNSLKIALEEYGFLVTIENIREIYEQIKESQNLRARENLLLYLIDNTSVSYWEHHALASIYQAQGDFEEAVVQFDQFFSLALEREDNSGIKAAIVKILECLVYVEQATQTCKEYLQRCPSDIRALEEVASRSEEILLMEQSQELLKLQYAQKNVEIGRECYSSSQLEKLKDDLKKKVTVHPSYKDFYELFKACSACGENSEATGWLRKAYEANVLLFKLG